MKIFLSNEIDLNQLNGKGINDQAENLLNLLLKQNDNFLFEFESFIFPVFQE
jgi:hypothetical protein